MNRRYLSFAEDSSDEDDDVITDIMDANVEPPSTTRRDRCLDFWFCRRNSATMLLVLDILFLLSTLWAYADVIIGLIRADILGHGTNWWFYVLLALPPLAQVRGIIVRFRYAFSNARLHGNIDWQLRYVSQPYMQVLLNGLAFDVYLFVMPLYAAALTPKVANNTEAFSAFVSFLIAALLQPSSIAFSALGILLMFCNWRVSSKHRWRVKSYVAVLRNAARNAQKSEPRDMTGPAVPAAPLRPTVPAPMPDMRSARGSPAGSMRGQELRMLQAEPLMLREVFIPERNDGDSSPRSKHHKSKSSSSSKKRSAARRLDARANRSTNPSIPSLDDSARSDNDIAGERW